jgi:transcriptional regulator with XRE-family HTH domain
VKHAASGRTRSRRGDRGGLAPGAFGKLLADLRAAKRLSLREVESATEHYISNAYLSQLEQGKIKQPSPSTLQRLAAVYGVPYETLMEKAGYLMPAHRSDRIGRRRRLAAFAISDLTAEEEEKLLEYLAFIRSRRR